MTWKQFGVLLLILTLLAMLALGGLVYWRISLASRPSLAAAQLMSLTVALEMYHQDFGAFPPEVQGIALLRAPIGRGPYIARELIQDPWGRAFLYRIDRDGQPIVETLGEDGRQGGVGHDKDLWKKLTGKSTSRPQG